MNRPAASPEPSANGTLSRRGLVLNAIFAMLAVHSFRLIPYRADSNDSVVEVDGWILKREDLA